MFKRITSLLILLGFVIAPIIVAPCVNTAKACPLMYSGIGLATSVSGCTIPSEPTFPTVGMVTLRYDASSLTMAADMDSITTWTDDSGNAEDYTGSATFNCAATGFNSFPALDFDGSTNGFNQDDTGTFQWIANNAWTMYVVFRADSIDTASSNPWENDELIEFGVRAGLHLHSTGPYVEAWGYNGTVAKVQKTIATGNTYLATAHFDGTNIYLSVNGDSEGSALCTTLLDGNAAHYTSNAGGRRIDGRIAEIIVANENHDATELSNMKTYFNTKYMIW